MKIRLNRPFLTAAASVLLTGTIFIDHARAEAGRSSSRSAETAAPVSATRTYAFTDGAIYNVRTAPGRVTDIALQPGEILGAVASGDTARWVIGDTASGSGETLRAHVLIKPVSGGLSTNLVITTDRRVYHITVTSAADGAMSAVAWSYPQDALIALNRKRAAAQAAVPVASGIQVDQLRFN